MPTLAVIWRSAGSLLAVHASEVVEVLPPVASRSVPGVPGWVRGLFVFRGRLIPLVDCAELLGEPDAPQRMMNRVLVLRVGGGNGAGRSIGLWVECVLDVGRVEFAASDSHPGFSSKSQQFLGPVAQTRWGLVQLVTASHLFTPDQLQVLTQHLEEAAA